MLPPPLPRLPPTNPLMKPKLIRQLRSRATIIHAILFPHISIRVNPILYVEDAKGTVGGARVVEKFSKLFKIAVDFSVYDLLLEGAVDGRGVVAVVDVEAPGLVARAVEGAAPEDGLGDAAGFVSWW